MFKERIQERLSGLCGIRKIILKYLFHTGVNSGAIKKFPNLLEEMERVPYNFEF